MFSPVEDLAGIEIHRKMHHIYRLECYKPLVLPVAKVKERRAEKKCR